MVLRHDTAASDRPPRRLRVRRLLPLLIALAVALPGLPVLAQVSAVSKTPQADFNLVQVLNCDPNGPVGACDQVARGVAPVIDMFFPGPGDYQVQGSGSFFELTFEHSAVLLPDLSTLTILLNGVKVPNSAANPNDSVRLDSTNRTRTTLRVDLPADVLKPDFNVISLQFYQRFHEPCDDPNNPALASKVYESTRLHYEYSPGFPLRSARPALDLKDFPYPFFRSGYTRAGETYFVFPQNPDRAELTAGASVAASIGNIAGSQPLHFNSTTVDKLTDDVRTSNDIIAIGTPARNPLVSQIATGTSISVGAGGVSFAAANGAPAPDANAGIIVLNKSPFDQSRVALAVSGANDDAIVRGAYGLADKQTRRLFQGDAASVSQPTDLKQFQPAPVVGQTFDKTLADLGLTDTTVTGTGIHIVGANFDGPPAPDQPDANLRLIVSHSTLLDAKRSSIKVTLNGVSVASGSLDNTDVNRGILDLKISGKDIHPGLNALNVVFGTYATAPEDINNCITDNPDRAWATLWSDSSIHINGGGVNPQPPDATFYPYPFMYEGNLAGTYIVVTPDQETLQRGLETAADIGRKSQGTNFLLGMVSAGDLNNNDKQNANLIVVGRPTLNPIIPSVNDQLPVQFQVQNGQITDKIEQNRPEVLIATRDRAVVGVVEIIPSPYNQQRTMVVETGTAPDGLAEARIALSKPAPLSNVLIASDTYKPPTVLTLATQQTKQAAASTQKSTTAKNALPLITAIFIIAALVLAALWIYAASRRAQEER